MWHGLTLLPTGPKEHETTYSLTASPWGVAMGCKPSRYSKPFGRKSRGCWKARPLPAHSSVLVTVCGSIFAKSVRFNV